jgi:AcrR family transcriptional regulator
VEPLARSLRVSKGSFYWHFKDREELLECLLCEWETEKSSLFDLLEQRDRGKALDTFYRELGRRVRMSERGKWPSDAAIFAWASVSPKVARRANREEAARLRLLKQWIGNDEIAEYTYMAYLGFLLRRRRSPSAVRNFPILAAVGKRLVHASKRTHHAI